MRYDRSKNGRVSSLPPATRPERQGRLAPPGHPGRPGGTEEDENVPVRSNRGEGPDAGVSSPRPTGAHLSDSEGTPT